MKDHVRTMLYLLMMNHCTNGNSVGLADKISKKEIPTEAIKKLLEIYHTMIRFRGKYKHRRKDGVVIVEDLFVEDGTFDCLIQYRYTDKGAVPNVVSIWYFLGSFVYIDD
jgi:hypothetical protein